MIQVHGCFWHAHSCALSRIPKTRTASWEAKFGRNKDRDKRWEQAAADLGWTTLVVWECEVDDERALHQRLVEFLGPTRGMELAAS
jgi:DNA mismatch endonuclease (patch repair protein)